MVRRAALFCTLAVAGCGAKSSYRPDAGLGDARATPVDARAPNPGEGPVGGSGDGTWCQDSNMAVEVLVSEPWPAHLSSGLSTSPEIRLDVFLRRIGAREAKEALLASVELFERTSRTPVPLTLTDAQLNEPGGTLRFRPTHTLTPHTDYVLHLRPTNLVKPLREHTLFHVSSLPRVRYVHFKPDASDTSKLVGFSVTFSEGVLPDRAAQAVSLSDPAGNRIAYALLNARSPGPDYLTTLAATFATPLAASTTLRLQVSHTVELLPGLALDGDYSGVAGQAALELVLVPAKLPSPGGAPTWEPTLTF